MVKNHARKNAARARVAEAGGSHQAAVAAVRKRPSLLPPPPTAEEILAEGRATIVAALGDLAEQTTHPRRRSLYLELQREVEASTTFANLRKARGTFAFRQADGYWLDRWNELSKNPPESYDEHLRGINRCYWARRVMYEWVWPGQWDKHLYGSGY
ncbi:hypothetical protein P3T36_006392 [Kitasatospora sp. MAP12-15]|uniref:hypothetical protein n=1 Tax=unclassified Kitasatospora TaxID=2633591 RepID=UPI002474F7B1|nr:hypothetical protein [Kitasatospora sp. MAP12-44]MDH6107933.1 hypothetical protein [Kitasatospora sp. MAP12-44]